VWVPQGAVILFLHYAFDRWMAKQYPQMPFDHSCSKSMLGGALAAGTSEGISALRRQRQSLHTKLYSTRVDRNDPIKRLTTRLPQGCSPAHIVSLRLPTTL